MLISTKNIIPNFLGGSAFFCKWFTSNVSTFLFLSFFLPHFVYLSFLFLKPCILSETSAVFCCCWFCSRTERCGRTHLAPLYCILTLHIEKQYQFTTKILTRMFYLLYFSFLCLANFCKKLFFSVQRFSPFFFCNTEAANAKVVLQEMV